MFRFRLRPKYYKINPFDQSPSDRRSFRLAARTPMLEPCGLFLARHRAERGSFNPLGRSHTMNARSCLPRLSIPWAAGLVVAALLSFPPAAEAASVNPVFVPGNPTCADLGYPFSFKIDPPNAGTYSIDGINTVTVTTDGISFDWSSTLGIDAVIGKGGPNANVYVYDPPAEATSDTDLHSPVNPSNGKFFGLSHIDFCFDYEVRVTKDAHTSFTRTYLWDLDKSVTPELWTLFAGDSGTSLYTLGVSRTGFTDSAWAVAGTITVYNPSPTAATVTGVADVVSPAIAAAVDCDVSFPYSLAGGGTLTCSYQTALPDGSNRINTATATTSG